MSRLTRDVRCWCGAGVLTMGALLPVCRKPGSHENSQPLGLLPVVLSAVQPLMCAGSGQRDGAHCACTWLSGHSARHASSDSSAIRTAHDVRPRTERHVLAIVAQLARLERKTAGCATG